jgi:hypothetical protein
MARARTRSVAAAERRAQQDAAAVLEPADFDGDDASATRRGRRARNDDRAKGRAVQSAVAGQSGRTGSGSVGGRKVDTAGRCAKCLRQST